MSDQEAFRKLKDFFETRTVCATAADPLRQSVEIGIVINDSIQCTFFKSNGKPRFEQREAKKPDIVFYMSPDAINSLVNDPSDDIGELGINIAKNYLARSVKIKIKGSILNLMTNGYLGIMKAGGVSFAKFLGSHGISGLGKIKDIFSKLKKD